MIQVTETTALHRRTAAMNEALMLSSIRQHEQAEAAEQLNARLQEAIGERQRISGLLRLLWEAASVLLATADPDTIIRELLSKIGPIMGLDTYFNYLVDRNGTALELASCAGVSRRIARSIKRLEFGRTISGTVAREHRTIYVPRVQQSRDPKAQAIKSFGLRAYLCNPLIADKVLLGTLGFGSRSRDEFAPGERAVLQTISYYVAVVHARLRTAKTLHHSEIRYRRHFEAAHDGVLLLDPATRKITDANPFMTKLLGLPRGRLVGQKLDQIGLFKNAAASRKMFRELQRTPKIRYENLRMKSAAGRHPEVEVVASLYSENGRPVVQCHVRDITQRKRAEAAERGVAVLAAANEVANREIVQRRAIEVALRASEQVQRGLVAKSRSLHAQLRHLTRDLMNAQEDERKKISRDLHDDVMQTLVGINVALAALTRRGTRNPAALKSHLARTQRQVNESLHAVHRFARDLRPAILDDFGLVPALQAFGQNLATRENFRLQVTATGNLGKLDSLLRTTLFRVAQEALLNVARHACARVARIRLARLPGRVLLKVQDDGKSFEVQATLAPGKNKRLGLLGMRERVEMMGGTLVITSAPGRGTQVRAEIPLAGKAPV